MTPSLRGIASIDGDMPAKGKVVAGLGAIALGSAIIVGFDGPAPFHDDADSAQEVEAGQRCHPSYSGSCLDPAAVDYDCAGGSGNGPRYTGTVTVTGPDVFGLDRDGDGVGCE